MSLVNDLYLGTTFFFISYYTKIQGFTYFVYILYKNTEICIIVYILEKYRAIFAERAGIIINNFKFFQSNIGIEIIIKNPILKFLGFLINITYIFPFFIQNLKFGSKTLFARRS